MKLRYCVVLVLLFLSGMSVLAEMPFEVTAAIKKKDDGLILTTVFKIAAEYHLYADKIAVTLIEPQALLQPLNIPVPERKKDAFSDEIVGVYTGEVSLAYEVATASADEMTIEVDYQGCSESMCFLPVRKKLTVKLSGAGVEPGTAARDDVAKGTAETAGWHSMAERFYVAGTTSGFLPPRDFLAFLARSETGRGVDHDSLRSAFETRGALLATLIVILSGLALNLTPCVLPMIPINIAIISVGSQGGSRARGFALGAVYGIGMAAAYGAVGLSVILLGARVGAMNSSPWFNTAIAVIFLVLSLGMFGAFSLDFSRFGGRTSGLVRRGGFAGVFLMGMISAMLAGACVAPAVLSVLLLSADLYARGNSLGLAFPFLLGLGMALPWPFAGAGLSFLPKPGRWMEKVKTGFGMLILVFAMWYGWESARMFYERSARTRTAVTAVQEDRVKKGWLTSLAEGLAVADVEKKPVLVDFWASWCKNCLAMDRITFSDRDVNDKLSAYVKIKVQAEDPDAPATKEILDHYCIVGLPTYVILKPGDPPPGMRRTPCEEIGKSDAGKKNE